MCRDLRDKTWIVFRENYFSFRQVWIERRRLDAASLTELKTHNLRYLQKMSLLVSAFETTADLLEWDTSLSAFLSISPNLTDLTLCTKGPPGSRSFMKVIQNFPQFAKLERFVFGGHGVDFHPDVLFTFLKQFPKSRELELSRIHLIYPGDPDVWGWTLFLKKLIRSLGLQNLRISHMRDNLNGLGFFVGKKAG